MNISTAYAECEAITRREARNFSYGIRLLPPAKRRALSAVYATARRIDDVGDGPFPAERKLAQLARLREQIHELQDGPPRGRNASDAVLVALADAARRFPIPLTAFEELLEGCEADVRGRRYKTFADLEWYCRCVAGSVGRLSLGVFDPEDRATAEPLADTLGIALQLTNILRDLREDRRRNRIYLPAEDLDRFGCRLDIDTQGRLVDPPGFTKLVRFEAERAEAWYTRGLTLLPYLDRRSRACTATMAGIYHRLLARIHSEPDLCRTTRVSLTPREKAAVAVRALVWGDA
ncbi:presqualene diphosphate synthase HpnD [Thermasporomyces composti]|jgi:phytoene synthase|uniref:Farnesyl-diphosphate farnesyltransferase n=1 Tax=Thermasporomyces composti TaxID=696763 RepID=A0A3D9V5X1_THECX|nr:presqualene diphosphate synthase HpnD [Thermasporomyces composti]REF36766.1 farnesyl-diphosphate farnesyltransferase [Thermasporomyces composti]